MNRPDAVREALVAFLREIDNIGSSRAELCEESIKALDRQLRTARDMVSAADTLEDKLRLLKEQRELERVRAERKRRLFSVLDDETSYAHGPVPLDELMVLVAPLRDALGAAAPAEQMLNGLTETEAAETASAVGLSPQPTDEEIHRASSKHIPDGFDRALPQPTAYASAAKGDDA